MTTLEIQAFLMIIKTGSISAAAEKLYVTQPALSRRIHSLENELGYRLIERNKGIRRTGLTPQGKAFILIAEKWLALWEETRRLTQCDSDKVFQVSSIGSVSTYILPEVIHRFMKEHSDCRLVFHQMHSTEAYDYMETGQLGCALISDSQFSRKAETMPAFREKMLLATNDIKEGDQPIHPSELDVGHEIRLPWNPPYDLWHDYWFGANASSKVVLDQMSLLENFFAEENTWAVVPATVAHRLGQNKHIAVHELLEPPTDRIVYYVVPKERKSDYLGPFFEELKRSLQVLPIVESYL